MSEAGKGRIPPKTGDAAAGSAPAKTANKHTVMLSERAEVQITGVLEVVSFDETAVELRTVCGELCVEGDGLHIGVLDTERGIVTLEGKSVDGIYYPHADSGERKGIWGRWRK